MAQQKPQFVRKHVFINRKLQGQYMLTFLIPMMVMLVFWIGSLYISADKIVSTTLSLVKKDVENSIAVGLQDKPDPSAEEYSRVIDEIEGDLRRFSNNRRYRAEIVSTLLWVFGIGLLLIIVQIGLLTIFFSHRIAGPIFRLEKACHAVINGDYTEQIRLRKHDEMQTLASLFNEMVQKTNDRIRAVKDADDGSRREEIASELKLNIDSKG